MTKFEITQGDIDRLKAYVDRDPQHGYEGGSSDASVNDDHNRRIYGAAHKFYNYQIHKWLSEVTR